MKGKNLNVGIQILRMIFSFHILLFHCINRNLYKSKIIISIIGDVNIDLGVFFIISFYYSYNSFTLKNIEKIKQRLYRLLIPYIIWPLLFFTIHNFTCYVSGKTYAYIKLKYLYYQLLSGNGIHIVFWFQFSLIILSLLFLIIIFASQKKKFFFLIIIGVLFYIFFSSKYYVQYLSYNTILLFSIRQLPLSYIYALFGFILFYLNNVVKFKKYIIKNLFICLIAFYLYIYEKHLCKIKAFRYMIKITTCIYVFIVFLILPFHEKNNYLIKLMASYSGGIYYLHIKMQILLEIFFKSMQSKTIIVCIINYLLCFLFCLIGSKIFKKSNLRYLFE